ncbi:UDP-N-acetylglucosamine--N-acetylmuramyl-(pentapeptide) pyrophosphoryl-undecaprenol N-acetylglucosamine transferase [Methylobacterium sp. Leaf399]|uniref:undecaprenyldiphospho-muramoylpentapeptide beta-N-acetylglucosaminyltransferase n=1 Tax=unclassified Methylobacterium TaxID=2615210 RepID=UPI0006F557B6|nr:MULTISPECIES: undecaprenyldiphospho-muramoylpentapeptide beta-N-acetylglucosaminyltransferase [unclassified Methylobacterium]KQT07285.1 UDP-N-acetylglucosamine--N-acetylmuramyl-(pentapeptide) pyrophosphoryl-undecaprenol N-acetylglucosamine transferase [Methylobacterium sp. Leaf399]KQT76875.1 UDP-N-acetylglucosamine--N-acetylmuramyl-(pentapeptide) pyrophosphoryl-undecaprenol N-acetylglucosamine transferase [Methylobacterium sp. Leaf466]
MTVAQATVLLCAGGTGGHLFPAESLAIALRARGVRVVLATDARVDSIATGFPASEIVTIASATPSGRSLVRRASALLTLGRGFGAAAREIKRIDPAAIVGFGGYPTVPPMLAGQILRRPTILHEQNAVMGRANAFLARGARAIATGFAEVRGIPEKATAPRTHTGNPLRPAVLAAAATYPPLGDSDGLHLLVFGGSQGAAVMGQIVPAAIAQLPADLRARLHLVQQVRAEDLTQVQNLYLGLGLAGLETAPFFKDLPTRMAQSHLVIGRSGASTVSELAAIGRPAILVPLPGALDQDQAANAATLSAIGAALTIPQGSFTPDRLTAELVDLFGTPAKLTAAAAAAKSAGIHDAAERLADVVIATAALT